MIRVFQLCNFVVFQAKQFLYFTSIYYVSSAPTLHGESFYGSLGYISFVNLEPVLLTQKYRKTTLSWSKMWRRNELTEFHRYEVLAFVYVLVIGKILTYPHQAIIDPIGSDPTM